MWQIENAVSATGHSPGGKFVGEAKAWADRVVEGLPIASGIAVGTQEVGAARYLEVLVLYLERPATQQYAVACSRSGRFGYSDLKEAAPMEGYVL